MRSYKRKKEIERKRRTRELGKFILPAIILSVVFAGFLFVILSPHHWNGKDKLSLTIERSRGDVSVIVFDPKLNEETILTIPGATEVNVAENLGSLIIKNVWRLGHDQKVGGRLLSETVTKNFLFPSYLWSDSNAESLISPNVSGLIGFVFGRGETNLGLYDKFSLALFSLKVRAIDRSEIDLGRAQFLRKGRISDGSVGFLLSGDVSERLTANFSDYGFSGRLVRVFIKDETGTLGVSDNVGQILEVMGGKVASIDKLSAADTDCNVTGGDINLVIKVAQLFSCKKSISGGKDDINIILGSGFAKRF